MLDNGRNIQVKSVLVGVSRVPSLRPDLIGDSALLVKIKMVRYAVANAPYWVGFQDFMNEVPSFQFIR